MSVQQLGAFARRRPDADARPNVEVARLGAVRRELEPAASTCPAGPDAKAADAPRRHALSRQPGRVRAEAGRIDGPSAGGSGLGPRCVPAGPADTRPGRAAEPRSALGSRADAPAVQCSADVSRAIVLDNSVP